MVVYLLPFLVAIWDHFVLVSQVEVVQKVLEMEVNFRLEVVKVVIHPTVTFQEVVLVEMGRAYLVVALVAKVGHLEDSL